jgi:hypothetical protein
LIPAQEVHASVGARGIALQHLFDEAHRLDVLLPVQRRAQAEARDGVGDRGLRHTLALMLAADRVLGRGLARREVVVHRRAHGGQPQPVLAEAMEELDDERGLGAGRQRADAPFLVRARDVGVGLLSRRASGEQFFGQPAQVLDQRELQHARPRPELADRQRRDPLVVVQEAGELLAIETAVAVPDELDRDRVDPRLARVLARGQRRQRPRVGAREVAPDAADLRRDQMEVVEQPVRGRRHEPPGPHVIGQRAIRAAQHPDVVLEPRERVARAMAPVGIDRQAGGERERALFQPLDAQELVAQRPFDRRRAAPRQVCCPRLPNRVIQARLAAMADFPHSQSEHGRALAPLAGRRRSAEGRQYERTDQSRRGRRSVALPGVSFAGRDDDQQGRLGRRVLALQRLR